MQAAFQDPYDSRKGSQDVNISTSSLSAFTKDQFDIILAIIQSSKIASSQPTINQVRTLVSTSPTPVKSSASGNISCSLHVSHCLTYIKSKS